MRDDADEVGLGRLVQAHPDERVTDLAGPLRPAAAGCGSPRCASRRGRARSPRSRVSVPARSAGSRAHRAARPTRPDGRERQRDPRRVDAGRASSTRRAGRRRRRWRRGCAPYPSPLSSPARSSGTRRPRPRCSPDATATPRARGRAARGGALRRLDRAQALKTLAKDPLWKVVQAHPSAVTFPGGESLRAMQDRAVDAVRDWNERARRGRHLGRRLARRRHQGRSSPTRSGCTSTSSSGSRSTRARSRSSATPSCGRSSCGSTTSEARWTGCCPRRRRRPGRERRHVGVRRRRRWRRGRLTRASPRRLRRLVSCPSGLRVRPARPVRRRHRRRARAAHLLPPGAAPAVASPASRWRSSRSACSPSASRSCSTRSLRRSGGTAPVPAVAPGRARRPGAARVAASPRSSGSARWRCPGTATPSGSSSRPARVTERGGRRPRRRRERARTSCGCALTGSAARAFVKRALAVV